MTSSTAETGPLHRENMDVFTGVQDSKFSQLEEYLKTWYDAIFPRYVDLVSDFAGQEFFLLDGEALVQYIFNDPMLDLGASKGGMTPSPLVLSLCQYQDFKCCTSFTLSNDSSSI